MMHRTRSLDYGVILSGEIDMMLDDTTVHLKQGDVVVQQATNHGWINHGTQPCRILFVLLDSRQRVRYFFAPIRPARTRLACASMRRRQPQTTSGAGLRRPATPASRPPGYTSVLSR